METEQKHNMKENIILSAVESAKRKMASRDDVEASECPVVRKSEFSGQVHANYRDSASSRSSSHHLCISFGFENYDGDCSEKFWKEHRRVFSWSINIIMSRKTKRTRTSDWLVFLHWSCVSWFPAPSLTWFSECTTLSDTSSGWMWERIDVCISEHRWFRLLFSAACFLWRDICLVILPRLCTLRCHLIPVRIHW